MAIGSAGAAVLAVAATGVAVALSTRSANVELAAGESGSVAAACKPGQKAVSGGLAGALSGDAALFAWGSRPQGSREWVAGAVDFGSGAGTLDAFVHCRKGARLRTKSASTTIAGGFPSAEKATLTAKCPSGTKVVSGGFGGQYGDGVDIRPYESRKSGGRRWTVSAFSYGTEAGTLTAYARCEQRGDGLKTKSAEVVVAGEQSATASAKCARSQRVVSGGFEGEAEATDVVPNSSYKQGGRRWTAVGFNGGVLPGSFTVFAYCEPR